MQLNNNLITLPKPNNFGVGAASSGPVSRGASKPLGSMPALAPAVVLKIAASAPPPAPYTVSTFLARLPTLSSPVNIADTAVNIAKNLNALNASLNKIGSVSQTGIIPQDLQINYEQYDTDRTAGNGSILSKLGAVGNPAGSNLIRVSAVSDINLSALEADARVTQIGVVGVSRSNLSDRLDGTAHQKITSVGVVGLTELQLTNDATSLNNAKVTSIGVVNVASANLNTVLQNTKIKTATVSGVTAMDIANRGSKAQVTGMTVTDESAKLALYFGNLLSYQSKITSVTQTGTAAAMTITGAQYKSASNPPSGVASLFSKFDDYSVNLTSVQASDVNSLKAQSKVLAMIVQDSGQNLSLNFDSLNSGNNLNKISSIRVNANNSVVTVSKSQYDSGSAAGGALTKFSNTYYSFNLSISGAQLSDLASLTSNSKVSAINLVGVAVSDVVTAATNALVKSIQVVGTASQVQNNLALLAQAKNIAKISQISNSASIGDTRDEIIFTPATYNTQLVNKLAGFSTAVSYGGTASRYSITTDASGNRTITPSPGVQGDKKQTYQNNVNFFKFSDKNLFGTTGNQNVDAILLGGTKYWWCDTAPAATSGTAIIGSMNALTSGSSKHTLTYSFLTSGTIASASNPGGKDLVGFTEMSDAEKTAVQKALDYISSVTNLTFNAVQSGSLGDINFGTNNQGTASGAYAYNPNTANHINLMMNNNPTVSAGNGDFSQGTYGWETLIHEIGHALGLKHPGNYNAGGGGTVGPYLPGGDAGSRRYTVMSYNDSPDAKNVTATPGQGGTSYSWGGLNPGTFMQYDLAALQFLYGVNTSAASSNDEGASTATASDFQTTTFTSGWRGFEALYGPTSQTGISLDLQGITTNQNILDLRSGAFSSINVLPSTVKSNLPASIQKNQTYFGYNNVALAYGSQINSVTGGGATDIYYVGDKNVTITDASQDNRVYLGGSSSEWTYLSGTYTKGSQNVTLVGSGFSINYYNLSSMAMTHTALDLIA